MKPWMAAAWIAVSAGLLGPAVQAQGTLTPASLTPCPFTAAEIEATLGLAVEDGQAADMSSPGGRDVGCLYAVQGSETAVTVRQQWDPAAATSGAARVRTPRKSEATITSADNAAGHGEPRAELSYSRGKVRVLVSVHGGAFNDSDMRARLVRLRQVP